MKGSKVCIKTRSPSASHSFKGKVTKYTTVKWTIAEKTYQVTNGFKYF